MSFECSFTISPPKKPAFEDASTPTTTAPLVSYTSVYFVRTVSSRPLLINIFLIRVSSSRSGGTIPARSVWSRQSRVTHKFREV
ncbi:hypothetical protein BS47DRAFT_1336361 [Hydnum rufescens UP504]|uniref:Uncharacterized protein n=1 Tax=Hydnum rufescens UP504 TaxID=1448309 RepID=A0A9P6E2D1_9AGAM|nr:hypothetical protein BS47DRAFT_1336361 [Hydnum rufescens UP504]